MMETARAINFFHEPLLCDMAHDTCTAFPFDVNKKVSL